ncbi:MAG: putative nucleic acid-binding protein [Verrucomicrobiales bacterium]|jgi:predicted nucleic acid-binding protein
MVVLDTNHIVELGFGTAAGIRRAERLEESLEPVFTTIICAEEQLRGWIAELHRVTDLNRQIGIYERLRERIDFYAR